MGQVAALHTSFSSGILFFFFLCFQHSNSSGPGADSPFLGSWVMLLHHWPVLSHYGTLTLMFVFPASLAATPCCSPFISLLVHLSSLPRMSSGCVATFWLSQPP